MLQVVHSRTRCDEEDCQKQTLSAVRESELRLAAGSTGLRGMASAARASAARASLCAAHHHVASGIALMYEHSV